MATRDNDWFESMFRAHVAAVRRYVIRRCPEEADDLTAEAFAVAWRRREEVPSGFELPWLYRTCANLIANHRRRLSAVPTDEFPELADDVDPAALVIADDQVRRALLRLSPRDRQILLLHAWEGLVGESLAAVLGVSRGGADAALSRARTRLDQAWRAEDGIS